MQWQKSTLNHSGIYFFYLKFSWVISRAYVTSHLKPINNCITDIFYRIALFRLNLFLDKESCTIFFSLKLERVFYKKLIKCDFRIFLLQCVLCEDNDWRDLIEIFLKKIRVKTALSHYLKLVLSLYPRGGTWVGPKGLNSKLELDDPDLDRPSSLALQAEHGPQDVDRRSVDRRSVDCSTITDVSCSATLDEVEIVSLLEESIPKYKLR